MIDRKAKGTANDLATIRPTLEGVLERIVFFNEENSFTVARLQVPGKKDLVTIVGALSLPTPGETLRLKGQWMYRLRMQCGESCP
jgi:hypothetical protein